MANNEGRELAWDDVIEKDSDYVLLSEGEYDFEVITFERGRHQGSDKLPPCNKVTVHIQVEGAEGTTTIKHNLFLHSITEGMLSAFFAAIGQKKKNEPLKMDWNRVPGSKGRAKVGIRKFINNDGNEMQFNEIKRFIPAAAAAPAQTNFKAGEF